MPSVDETEIVEYFDDLLVHLPVKEKLLIRCLLTLLEVQMLVLNGTSPKFFSEASLDERTRNLAGWEASRIFQRRLVFMAIRTLLLWGYVDSQEAERDMGFVSGTRRTRERNERRLEAARRAIADARGDTPTTTSRPSSGRSPSSPPGVLKSAPYSALEDQA